MTVQIWSSAKRAYDRALTTAGTQFARLFLYAFSCLESIIIPIPTDPLLAACVLAKPQRWLSIAVYCALASVLGGAIGWALGAFAAPAVMAAAESLPHAIFSAEKFEIVAQAFQKLGLPLVLIGAFTPLPFKVIAISAGLFAYPLIPFLIIATIGRMARFLIVAAMVRYHKDSKRLVMIASGALVLVLIGFWMLG